MPDHKRHTKKCRYSKEKRQADKAHSKSGSFTRGWELKERMGRKSDMELACFVLDRKVLVVGLVSLLKCWLFHCNKRNVPPIILCVSGGIEPSLNVAFTNSN